MRSEPATRSRLDPPTPTQREANLSSSQVPPGPGFQNSSKRREMPEPKAHLVIPLNPNLLKRLYFEAVPGRVLLGRFLSLDVRILVVKPVWEIGQLR